MSKTYLNGERVRYRREQLGLTRAELEHKMNSYVESRDGFSIRPDDIYGVRIARIEHDKIRTELNSPNARALSFVLSRTQQWLALPDSPYIPRRYEAVMATREKYRG